MNKDIGTLKEIGAQVGDVVQVVGGPSWKIIGGDADKGFIIDDPVAPKLSRTLPFRIVSRSQTGPVRTVTRHEIVPGVYGKVMVHPCGDYTIDQCTTDELTDAIATLTAIRNAMADSSDDVSTAQAR